MHKKITDARTHQNIKLFIIKLITNRPKVFQPYAKYWLCGLAQFVIGGHCGAGMNYFVVDVVVTMLSWSATATLEVCTSSCHDIMHLCAWVLFFVSCILINV